MGTSQFPAQGSALADIDQATPGFATWQAQGRELTLQQTGDLTNLRFQPVTVSQNLKMHGLVELAYKFGHLVMGQLGQMRNQLLDRGVIGLQHRGEMAKQLRDRPPLVLVLPVLQ